MGFSSGLGLLLDDDRLVSDKSSVCQGSRRAKTRRPVVSGRAVWVYLVLNPAEGFAVFYENKDGPLLLLEAEGRPGEVLGLALVGLGVNVLKVTR